MILTSENLEKTLITPIIIPRIGHEPVGSTFLHTPTDDPDSMTPELTPGHVLIHARLVVGEVGVD